MKRKKEKRERELELEYDEKCWVYGHSLSVCEYLSCGVPYTRVPLSPSPTSRLARRSPNLSLL